MSDTLASDALLTADWQPGQTRAWPVTGLCQRYRRYRLVDSMAEAAMVQSLIRHGQLSPLVVCRAKKRWR